MTAFEPGAKRVRLFKVIGRSVITVVSALALTATMAVTPAIASPVFEAARTAAATRAEVLAAAAKVPLAPTEPEAPAEPVAEGTITPDQSSTITADEVGAEVTFSGHQVDENLAVTVTPLSDTAAQVAESETGGVAVSTPIDITATAGDGADVTQFPADAETVKAKNGVQEYVTSVDPGVALEIDIDESQLGDVDTSTLKLYTRETPGEPWTELPSYYDAETGTVKGESNHLSEFVVIGTPFPVPPGPIVVLDPDDDIGHTTGPGSAMTELPQNIRLARGLAAMLEQRCNATVVITRQDPAQPFVSADVRAGIAASANPTLTATLAFNAYQGHAWGGSAASGGTEVYSRGGGTNAAVAASLNATLPNYTGRPSELKSSPYYPNDAFDSVPGTKVHLETLFIDHNWDRPVIDNGFPSIVDGVFTGLGQFLQSQGFDCTDPVTGGWPTPPSAAELAKWRNLGHQNYLMYGADPVSFSTGNLIEDEPIFSLTGPGEQNLDLTLVYNSQDGREARTGAGWSFGVGARAQRFIDKSVLIVRGDGASFVFNPDGAGGYSGEDGLYQTLTEAGAGQLKLTAADGETWVFDAADIDGIGELVTHTDRQGNSYTLGYGAANPDVNKFVPLTSITDAAGQTVSVGNDAQGRITSFTHPDGRSWGLAYDGAGNLVSITNPDGRIRSFTYDDQHRMLTATDAAGVLYLKNEYDADGRVVKQWDAEGNLRTFVYNTADGETVYTDNEGTETVFHYDERFRITGTTNVLGDSTAYVYNDRNEVESYTDEAGHVWAYEYDDNGNLITETLPDDSVIAYTYTPTGEVASVTDQGGPDGAARTTSYEIDPLGLMTGVTMADGTAVSSAYDARGNLTSMTSASGATTSIGYDARGNATTVTDANGHTTTFAYDLANRVTSTTDANGATTTFVWDAGDRLVSSTDANGATTSYAYDANDHLVAVTDATGAVSRYEWDTLFRLAKTIAADGGETTYEYNTEDKLTKITDSVGAVTTFTLDELYRPVTVTDPNGGEWFREFDAIGNVTAITDPIAGATTMNYDELSRPKSTVGPTGITETTAYDTVGRAVSVSDALGNTYSYAYDLLDRTTSIIDPQGETLSYAYDVDSRLVGVTDRQGNTTTNSYDPAGQLTGTTDPLGGASVFEYDPVGNVTAIVDELGRQTDLAYDGVGQLTSMTDPLGDTTAFAYDAVGRSTSVTDPNGHTSIQGFDAVGRVVQSVDPAGDVTKFVYDLAGQQTATVDPLGNETRYKYDPAGQLTTVIEGYEAGADPSADVNVTTKYGYTAAGNMSSIVDPNGNTTSFAYDAAGQVTSETNPLGKTWSYIYDQAGQLTSQKDGLAWTTSYAYTARGDVSQITYPGDDKVQFEYDANQQPILMTDSQGTTGWTYDALGRTTAQIDTLGKRLEYAYDAASQLTGLTLPGGDTVGYEYDAAGRPTTQTSPWGDIAYEWDPASNLTAQVRSSGVNTTYAYDAADRPTSIVHQLAAVETPAAEDTVAEPVIKRGEVACQTAGNYLDNRTVPSTGGKDCVKTWDYLDRRTMPETPNPVADVEQLRFDYDYDADSNVTAATRTLTGAVPETVDAPVDPAVPTDPADPSTGVTPTVPEPETPVAPSEKLARSFSYDNLNRLVASELTGPKSVGSDEQVTATAEYSYDPAGNRTEATIADPAGPSTTVAQFNAGNQLTSTQTTGSSPGSASYGYDGNGNRTTETVDGVSSSYSFDATGRVISAATDGRSTSYAYDGLGRQVSSTDTNEHGSQTTTQVWDGLQPVQQSNAVSGVTNLMRDATGNLALQATDDAEKWALLDRLGSTVAQTDGGRLAQLSDYSDFGVQDFETIGWDAALNYTGETTDPGYRQNQYFARSYDPTSGSWMSQDSWRGLTAAPQTVNRYAYVLNSPTTFQDHYGYSLWDDVVNFGKSVVKGAINIAKKAVNAVVNTVKKAVNTVAAAATQLARGLLGAAGQILNKAARAAVNAVSNVVNGIKNTVNNVHRAACAIVKCPRNKAGNIQNRHTGNQTNKTTVIDLGVQWLSGKGPRDQQFRAGDPALETLKGHWFIQDSLKAYAAAIEAGTNPSGEYTYSLSGAGGVINYARDATTNSTAFFLGSYSLKLKYKGKNPDGSLLIDVEVFNSTSLQSGTRPPVIGYTDEWKDATAPFYEPFNKDGPMSPTTQTFKWTATVKKQRRRQEANRVIVAA